MGLSRMGQIAKCRWETNASTTREMRSHNPRGSFKNSGSQPENGRRLSDQQFQNARPSTEVQEGLKPDELLEYVLDDPTSFCVLVSRKKAYVRALPAGRKEIEKLSQEFVGEIRIPEAAAATRFIIAPDGILNLLPFEVLRHAQSSPVGFPTIHRGGWSAESK